LPVPQQACGNTYICSASAPEFYGRTGYEVIDNSHPKPYFMVSQNVGVTWRVEPLPTAAGSDPQILFFTAQEGMLIPATEPPFQDAPQNYGGTFYLTTDGGRTWTPVPQGRRFSALTTIDFVSAQTGFAWLRTGKTTLMYETRNSGRTWAEFTPRFG
jgi:hypothetical protein